MTAEARVIIVFDPESSSRIEQLSENHPVWIVQSPPDLDAVNPLWTVRRFTHHRFTGVTTLRSAPFDSGFLSIIENYHGLHAQDPPVGTLEVVGLELEPRFAMLLAEYGYFDVSATDSGFIARRSDVDARRV
jgi:hypothetical protein